MKQDKLTVSPSAHNALVDEEWSGVVAIVYMVSALDPDGFPESKDLLRRIMAEEKLAHCPILVLGNKMDRRGVATEDEIRSSFELITTGKVRNCVMVMSSRDESVNHLCLCFFVSFLVEIPVRTILSTHRTVHVLAVLRRYGYKEGFRWLADYIPENGRREVN